jgi:hypothetical protein
VPIIPPPLDPDGPFFSHECVTTPEVTIEVPDFDHVTWNELPAPDASLQLSLVSQGLSLALVVDGVDEPIAIPALLN